MEAMLMPLLFSRDYSTLSGQCQTLPCYVLDGSKEGGAGTERSGAGPEREQEGRARHARAVTGWPKLTRASQLAN